MPGTGRGREAVDRDTGVALAPGTFSVGFIGLGDMGSAIAGRIAETGFRLVLWARHRAAAQPFAGTGARIAASPADLAAQCDLVGLCVTGDADVEEVLLNDNGVLEGVRPGTVIAVHSTVSPLTCRRLATAASERGAELIDAPVSGGRNAAAAAEVLEMVGGPEQVFHRCLPVFRSFGSNVVHVGPLGAAQLAKLVNNTLLTANMALANQAIELGQRLGLDEETLGAVLQLGTARSFALEVTLTHRSSPEPSESASTLLSKDVQLLAGVTGPPASRGPDGSLLFMAAREMLERLARELDQAD